MGLNFQTCTIINSLKDADSNKDLLTAEGDVLHIKRDFVFDKNYVKSVTKTEGYDAVPCAATVNFAGLAVGNYRLEVFVKYEGAEPAFGANAVSTFKGIPFWVEFSVKEGTTDIASVVAAQIKKDHLFLIDKDILTVTPAGNVLTIEGATEYIRFKTIQIVNADTDEVVEEISEGENAKIKVTQVGVNGFGTYSHLIKDLRLPTAANSSWTALRQDETPVVGALYNQYIIEYCAPAINEGTMFVGHRGMNWTTHVFWVQKGAVATAWETALKNIDPDGGSLEASNVAASIEDSISELEDRISELEKA